MKPVEDAKPASERMLTPPEVARLMKVNADKVLDWIRRGELQAVNISNGVRPRYRIEPSDLADFKLRRSSRAAVPVRRGRGPRWDCPTQTANCEHSQ